MTVFWTLYWLGFLGIPLIILLAGVTHSSGYEKDTSHIWVYKRSGAKSHDANIREVWEHNHPGKKWEDRQARLFTGSAIFFGIAFIIFLAWLADKIFSLPQDQVGLRLFWQIGAPILGGLSAVVFYGLQSVIAEYKSDVLKVLHIIALAIMGLGVIVALVLTFLNQPLPISQHWIWAPAGAMSLFLILDSIGHRTKNKKAGKGGAKLEKWVREVLSMFRTWDLDEIEAYMTLATIELQQEKLDWKIRNDRFFKLTEGVLLDLVRGKPMSISDDEIYSDRDSVIKAVQAFYFYMVEHFSECDLHPKIKQAIGKQR